MSNFSSLLDDASLLPSNPYPVLIVCGPTATGKSSLVSSLPSLASLVVVNCDSMQIYSNLPVATAAGRIDAGKMYQVRDFIEDDLLGCVDGLVDDSQSKLMDEPNLPRTFRNYTVRDYLGDASEVVRRSTGPVVFCGGTMYYVEKLVESLTGSVRSSAASSPPYSTASTSEWYASLERPYETLLSLEPDTTIHPSNTRATRNRLLHLGSGSGTHNISPGVGVRAGLFEPRRRIMLAYCDYASEDTLKSRISSRIASMQAAGLQVEVEALYNRWISVCSPEPSQGVPNVGLFQAIGFRQFVPYLQSQKSWLECVEELERDTMKYVKSQRKFFEGKVLKACKRGGVEGVQIRMDDVDAAKVGEVVDGFFNRLDGERSDEELSALGVKRINYENVSLKPPDMAVRACDACGGVKCYGAREWEQHLKGKMHKVRGSKKFREAQEKRREWEAKNKKVAAPTAAPQASTAPCIKNSANKNKYTTDADKPFTSSVQSFGQQLQITIHQTSAEATWPGGALWDPGVVVSKLFCLPDMTPVRQSSLRSMNVIELGAGCGMTGIVLAALGARWVAVTDMDVVMEGITKRNVEANAVVVKGRAKAMPLPWGEEYFGRVEELFEEMTLKTKTDRVDLILAVDIAYQRPGLEPHFHKFLQTLLKIHSLSGASKPQSGPRRKKKASTTTISPSSRRSPPLFVYGHRRRMGLSEDLLHLVYEHFEDVRDAIPAHEIDPKFFKASEKHGINVHILKIKDSIS